MLPLGMRLFRGAAETEAAFGCRLQNSRQFVPSDIELGPSSLPEHVHSELLRAPAVIHRGICTRAHRMQRQNHLSGGRQHPVNLVLQMDPLLLEMLHVRDRRSLELRFNPVKFVRRFAILVEQLRKATV